MHLSIFIQWLCCLFCVGLMSTSTAHMFHLRKGNEKYRIFNIRNIKHKINKRETEFYLWWMKTKIYIFICFLKLVTAPVDAFLLSQYYTCHIYLIYYTSLWRSAIIMQLITEIVYQIFYFLSKLWTTFNFFSLKW